MGVMYKSIYCLLLLCVVTEKTFSDDIVIITTQRDEPGKDPFRVIMSNISSSRTEEEVQKFLNYTCEVMIVISNEAQAPVRLRCTSATNAARQSVLTPGNSLVFTIKPHVDGTSDFWCNLAYNHLWARFDAYTEDHPNFCPRNKLYRYSIKHDGLYADPDKDGGNKIRSLYKGHNGFSLWEIYDNVTGTTDGLLMSGFVDGGMCSEIPDHLDDRAAVISVCDHQCVLAYDYRRCKGPYEKLQAGEGCQDFRLDSTLSHKISSIKGC